MDSHKVNRGHESQEHIQMKLDGITALRRRGFDPIFPEHYNCDLVAVRHMRDRYVVVDAEFERTARHVTNNTDKGFRTGCHYILIVALNEGVLSACVNKLRKHIVDDRRSRIYLITFEDFIAGKLPVSMPNLCSGSDPTLFTFVHALFGVCSRNEGLCSGDSKEVQH